MLRTIIWFIYFWLFLVFTLPFLAYAKIQELRGNTKARDRVAAKAARIWSRSLIWLAGGKVTVIGQENLPKDQQVVFIGNHQGNFDIPLLLGYVDKPLGFIAKIEMLKMPIVCAWMKYLHCVFMDRNDIRQSVSAINEGVENIKNGHSIAIFPEGTRSKGDKVGEFKAGSFKLATKANALIVPLTMKNSYKLFEANNKKMKPAKVEIIISPPINTKDLSAQEIKELPDTVRNIIVNNLN
jgi:1-acyl-sn-glycerol-3-phosphate acyltransferase